MTGKMAIKARYEDGAFWPLRKVPNMKQGQVVELTVKEPLTSSPAFGMWKGRKEMQDSVSYVRKLRKPQWRHA